MRRALLFLLLSSPAAADTLLKNGGVTVGRINFHSAHFESN